MLEPTLSVNRRSLNLVEKFCDDPEMYGVLVEETGLGATLIDAGIRAKGGYLAGRIVTEVCLGGLGEARIFPARYGDLELPSIFVCTDHPAIATLGSQFAGWRIKVGDYQALGSGPARALSLKPKELYAKIGYKDEADTAVMVLETAKKPTDQVIEYITKECKVNPEKLYLLMTPTSSLAGSTQISGRVVETGLHKLTEVGFDPKRVLSGFGSAPIAPIHPKFTVAMGRTNDMLLYGGMTYFTVDWEDDDELAEVVERVPSSSSKDYGRPFAEVFKAAGHDFYRVDPGLFAPAVIVVNNAKTGRVHRAGRVNVGVLRKSIGWGFQ